MFEKRLLFLKTKMMMCATIELQTFQIYIIFDSLQTAEKIAQL